MAKKNKTKVLHICKAMPAGVEARLDNEYLDMMQDAQDSIRKNMSGHQDKQHERYCSTDPELMALPHPLRMKYVKMIPLHIQWGAHDEEETAFFLLAQLAEEEMRACKLIEALERHSPGFRSYMARTAGDVGTLNFGGLETVFYPHRFFATGAKFLQVSDLLMERLEGTSCYDTPCRYLTPPFPTQYIACNAPITVYNAVSGAHKFEGCYLNTFTIPAAGFDKEFDTVLDMEQFKGTLTWFGKERGYLKKGGGDVVSLEFMATGSPTGKKHITDDATYNFSLLLQDLDKPLQEVLDFHIDYYRNIFGSKVCHDNTLLRGSIPMPEDEVTQFSEVITWMTKVLLFINGDVSELEHSSGATRLKQEMRRTLNKAKAKKLQRQLDVTVDKYIIDCFSGTDKNEDDFMQPQIAAGQIWDFNNY